ncbi:unnamed protein product, partial [Sphacelaria rigidula]
AVETRIRLLTLEGEWLEKEGRILREQQQHHHTATSASGGAKHPAKSYDGALASLEEAAEIGDGVVTDGEMTSSLSSSPAGIVGAAGEAMLKLAKLCETLATSADGILEGAGWGVIRGREKLAALSVKRYLSAMAAGSADARDRFPRVLFLVGEFSKAREAFAE